MISYPSLFELERIAIAISDVIDLESVFHEFRYSFLLDQIRSERFGYDVQILPDEMMRVPAYVDTDKKKLFLRASIYAFGRKGAAHPMMVLYHEFVHIYKEDGLRSKTPNLDLRKLCDPRERLDEMIANRVAGAIAMPFAEAVAKKCWTRDDLVRIFRVTEDAADIRIRQIKEMMIAERGIKNESMSPKILAACQEYETKTNSKLRILDKARGTRGAKGYMVQACRNCSRSECTNDGTGFRCDGCGEGIEAYNVRLLTAPLTKRHQA